MVRLRESGQHLGNEGVVCLPVGLLRVLNLSFTGAIEYSAGLSRRHPFNNSLSLQVLEGISYGSSVSLVNPSYFVGIARPFGIDPTIPNEELH
jgi:hypothetical protein